MMLCSVKLGSRARSGSIEALRGEGVVGAPYWAPKIARRFRCVAPTANQSAITMTAITTRTITNATPKPLDDPAA